VPIGSHFGRQIVWKDRDLAVAATGSHRGLGGPGSGAGSVRIFRRENDAWGERQALTAPGGSEGDLFGMSMGISGNLLAIAAPFHEDGMGKVFLYERTDPKAPWMLVQALAEPGKEEFRFGWGTAVAGETVAVLSRRKIDAGSYRGRLLIYERGPDGWALDRVVEEEIVASIAPGNAVAFDGETLVVGLQRCSLAGVPQSEVPQSEVPQSGVPQSEVAQSGVAAVYERKGGRWLRVALLRDPSSSPNASFGYCVDLAGDWIAVGAFREGVGEPNPGSRKRGAVYLYRRSKGSGADDPTWQFHSRLVSGEPAELEHFGANVRIRGDHLVVSAVLIRANRRHDSSGKAYLFRLEENAWRRVARYAPNSDLAVKSFSLGLALDDPGLIAGAPRSLNDPDHPGAVFLAPCPE
ncbi:MAG: hypothetical protein HKO57_00505, partial [Akkermansiaceae bacterium]|nr:hypothetical protein [Akkermansiaceae bacterium]